MIRNQWQRRLLSCFLAFAVLLGCVLSCLPVRAGAIVPLGLVQSALASYVTSTGYKMYNDQGTGQDILGSLGEVYDDWVTINNRTLSGSLATLAFIASSPDLYVFSDNSGHIVIKRAAALIFQDFADSLQTDYSIPTDGTVVSVGESENLWSDGNGINAALISSTTHLDSSPSYPNASYYDPNFVCGYNSSGQSYFLATSDPVSFYVTIYGSNVYIRLPSTTYIQFIHSNGSSFSGGAIPGTVTSGLNFKFLYGKYDWNSLIPVSTVSVSGKNPSLSGSVATDLALSLGSAVADVAGRIEEDDESLVVGVGAGVGATAEDITGLVAQGVKAQTLDPAVTVVADAVIDTPVQPYPDIDGLGLPTLGAALVSRFPFCVPWDFVDTLRILNAAPIPPVFDVTLVPASVAARWGLSGNYTLHVDLTSPEYAKLFVALRWGTLVGFCLGLALLTKRLIWTA